MRSWKRCAALLAVLAAVAVVWPVSWGGQLGYVTTHGISMEPRFHTGDLAVVHPQRTYHVGEVTAYHNRMLHTVVLHRIVAVSGNKYTFKGDNNTWLDEEQPTRSQLIGALVLRIPQGGVWLRRVTSPPMLGLLAFALLAAGSERRRRRRRKGLMSRHAAPRRSPRRGKLASDPDVTRTAIGAGAAVVAIAALAASTWMLPATHLVPHKVTRTQTITMSYTAKVRPSPAYDGTTVTAPQPVFRNVTDAITLRANYRGTPGMIRLDAQLSTPGGWTSRLNLAPAATFSGDRYSATVPVRLSTLDHLAQAASRTTGLPAEPVTITVTPTVTSRGGHVFAPPFQFTLTALTLTAPTNVSGLTATAGTPNIALTPAPNDVHLLRHAVAVKTARRLTLAALAFALLTATVVLGVARARRNRGEANEIQRRWRDLLLEVQPMPTPPGRPVVDVPAFVALVQLAQRYELLIMHWARSGVHTYVVQDGTTVFRYRSAPFTTAPASSSPVTDEAVLATRTT